MTTKPKFEKEICIPHNMWTYIATTKSTRVLVVSETPLTLQDAAKRFPDEYLKSIERIDVCMVIITGRKQQ